jgi:hypothetical protein
VSNEHTFSLYRQYPHFVGQVIEVYTPQELVCTHKLFSHCDCMVTIKVEMKGLTGIAFTQRSGRVGEPDNGTNTPHPPGAFSPIVPSRCLSADAEKL